MAVDKQILELPVSDLDLLNSGLDMAFAMQVAGHPVTYQVALEIILAYIQAKPVMNVYGGASNPDNAQGKAGDLYFQKNGKVYLKQGATWFFKAIIDGNGVSGESHEFPIAAGAAQPLVISTSTWPQFTEDTIVVYEYKSGSNWVEYKDVVPVKTYLGTTFTGFQLTGLSDDGGATAAQQGRFRLITAPGDPADVVPGADLIVTDNEWQGSNIFDQPIKLKNGSLLSLIASAMTADKTWTFPNKSDTAAGLTDITAIFAAAHEWLAQQTFDVPIRLKSGSLFNTVQTDTLTANRTLTAPDKTGILAITTDIPAMLRLQASGTGSPSVITIAHGRSNIVAGVSVAVAHPCNSDSAGVGWTECDATNVYIHYGSLGPVDPLDASLNLLYAVTFKP